jgi:hypothetical protein
VEAFAEAALVHAAAESVVRARALHRQLFPLTTDKPGPATATAAAPASAPARGDSRFPALCRGVEALARRGALPPVSALVRVRADATVAALAAVVAGARAALGFGVATGVSGGAGRGVIGAGGAGGRAAGAGPTTLLAPVLVAGKGQQQQVQTTLQVLQWRRLDDGAALLSRVLGTRAHVRLRAEPSAV